MILLDEIEGRGPIYGSQFPDAQVDMSLEERDMLVAAVRAAVEYVSDVAGCHDCPSKADLSPLWKLLEEKTDE